MNVDENTNKDMVETDLINVDALSFSDDQTWLYTLPNDSGQKVDIVDWNLSCDWPIVEDKDYMKLETELYSLLDNIIKNDMHAPVDRHKFDSRTFVRPKRRPQRPSIHTMVDVVTANHLQSIPQHSAVNATGHGSVVSPNKYLTYNKYSAPAVSPMLRLKTFNLDVGAEHSALMRECAKRRSVARDDDPQLEDVEATLVSDSSGRQSSEHATPTRPINIDLSQPAHNLHNTFTKGLTNALNDRGSLNMFQSGESLMRMSPPSLVSSLQMESSGTYNPESLEGRRSEPLAGVAAGRESMAGRDSLDPMLTSMTLSILDEKDMSTSFLSQTTYPDHDSLMDSLPPSLVSSVNSSFVIPNPKKTDSQTETNIFSSATFTHLEHSERLLSSRPRFQLFNNVTKREGIAPSESYTKSREEGCQIETPRKDAPTQISSTGSMGETITLHYSNVKFKGDEAEKENFNSTFEKDDAFYKEMGIQKAKDPGKNSLNVTLDKQELNEIIQARQKLSLARKALPTEEKTPLPNQTDSSPIKTIQLPNQTITVPKHSMENASELLSRRRAQNGYERTERTDEVSVKRCATFKKLTPPKTVSMDKTMVYVKPDDVIDINSATMNLIDVSTADATLRQEEWCPQERAMVGSSESTDTGTFSSSSPPDSVPASIDLRTNQVASTPLTAIRKGTRQDLLTIQNTISPILNSDSPVSEASSIAVNSATIVKRASTKRDILAARSPERRAAIGQRISPTWPSSTMSLGSHSNLREPSSVVPPTVLPKKSPSSGLPTSKLRQYSSHKELNRIPVTDKASPVGKQVLRLSKSPGPAVVPSRLPGRGNMTRRNVYASNPVLSPPSGVAPMLPIRRDSYTVTQVDAVEQSQREKTAAAPPPPALVRQGTETLRRDRPPSQLVAPRDLRAGPGTVVVHNALPTPAQRTIIPPSASRGYSALPTTQSRVTRPSSGPSQRPPQVTSAPETRPQSSNNEPRVSALPRPSRLPAPRRALRPPSVYSVAPTADIDQY